MGRAKVYTDADKYMDDPKEANKIYNIIMKVLEGGYTNPHKKIRKEIAEVLNEKYFITKDGKISLNQISGLIHRLVVEHQAPIGSSSNGFYIIDDTADQEAALSFLATARGPKNDYEKHKVKQREKYDAIRKMHFPMATPSKSKDYHQWKEKTTDPKNKFGGASQTKQKVLINSKNGDTEFSEEFKALFLLTNEIAKKVSDVKKKVNERIKTQTNFSQGKDSISVFLNITPELVSFMHHSIPKRSKDIPITCNKLSDLLNDSVFFKGLIYITHDAVRALIWLLIVNHYIPIGSCKEGYYMMEYEEEKQEAIGFLQQWNTDTQRIKALEKMPLPKRKVLAFTLKRKLHVANAKKRK